jgi:hypothetical protein
MACAINDDLSMGWLMKTSILQIFTYVSLASCLLLAGCASDSGSAITLFCSAIKQIDRFTGQGIEVSGVVQSDAVHSDNIQDESCPDYEALLQMSPMALQNGSAELVRAAVMEPPAGTLEKRIEITARGHLQYQIRRSVKTRVFMVEEILKLEIIGEK